MSVSLCIRFTILPFFSSSVAAVKTTSSPLSLQKSQSFCSDKATKLMNNTQQNTSMNTSINTSTNTKNSSTSTKSITESDILNARSALKPSRSCPHELNDNDNSSSGVSSDQEQTKQNEPTKQSGNNGQPVQTTKFVTYLPIESSTPITKKSYDSESSESSFDTMEPQQGNGQNLVHMKKMLHPKLQAIFDLPPGSSYSSQTLPNR